MSERILEDILNGQIAVDLLTQWLTSNIITEEDNTFNVFECSRSDFIIYFLSYLRNQTDSILKTNLNALQILPNTPEKLLENRQKIISTTNIDTPEQNISGSNTSCFKDAKNIGSNSLDTSKKDRRRVKTKLFNEENNGITSCTNESRKSTDLNHDLVAHSFISESSPVRKSIGEKFVCPVVSSTPVKQNWSSEYPNLPPSPFTLSGLSESSRKYDNSPSYIRLSPNNTERSITPRRHSDRKHSLEKSTPNLGDFIVNTSKRVNMKKKKHHSRNKSHDSDDRQSLNDHTQTSTKIDLSSSDMFPEIGASRRPRSSPSKRRIKPTTVVKEDVAEKVILNKTFSNFTSDSLKRSTASICEENKAFKESQFHPKELSKSFNVERDILKKERHKLLEKFNVLNTNNASAVKILKSPQVKSLRSETQLSTAKYIDVSLEMVTFNMELDKLVRVHSNLLERNLTINAASEIHFLISLILSQQYLEDYQSTDVILKSFMVDGNSDLKLINLILKSLPNCIYYAVRTLWTQRKILEIMLDKVSLKLLGENKRVRMFLPDLAKFLLNLYGVRTENEAISGRLMASFSVDVVADLVSLSESSDLNTSGNVCFNSETDNVDNFPSMRSFQNFRKQRDLFYDTLRWWCEHVERTPSTGLRSGLHNRLRSLLALSVSPANHAHLARLLRAHLLHDCAALHQETKLDKLKRRLMEPATATVDQRLPKFSGKEEFYRDFLTLAECESFRSQVRDSLASELCSLNSSCVSTYDERLQAPHWKVVQEMRVDYQLGLKRLRVLAKFLALLLCLPYRPGLLGAAERPKDRVLESELALRSHTQPPIDLMNIINVSYQNGRLSVTIPWVIQYLAMLDYTSIRLDYYQRLLERIFLICLTNISESNEDGNPGNEISENATLIDKIDKQIKMAESQKMAAESIDKSPVIRKNNTMNNNIKILLQLSLGWLMELPHFPQEMFYDWLSRNVDGNLEMSTTVGRFRSKMSTVTIDNVSLVDELVVSEICPHLKELNGTLLANSCQPTDSSERGPSYRHITPVSTSLNSEDRMRNREKEIQARLQDQLLRSQPSSTRRTLSLIAERSAATTIAELSGPWLADKQKVVAKEVEKLMENKPRDKTSLHNSLQQLYTARLSTLRSAGLAYGIAAVRSRALQAASALLQASAPVRALAVAASNVGFVRVKRWIDDNWGSIVVFTKDLDSVVEDMLVLSRNSAVLQLVPETPSGSSSIAGTQVASAFTCDSEQFLRENVSAADCIVKLRDLICCLISSAEYPSDLEVSLEQTEACCRPTNLFISPHALRLLMQLSVDLIIFVVAHHPQKLTDAFIQKFHQIWDRCCPNRQPKETIEDESCLLLPDRRDEISPIPRASDLDGLLICSSDEESGDIQDESRRKSAEGEERTGKVVLIMPKNERIIMSDKLEVPETGKVVIIVPNTYKIEALSEQTPWSSENSQSTSPKLELADNLTKIGNLSILRNPSKTIPQDEKRLINFPNTETANTTQMKQEEENSKLTLPDNSATADKLSNETNEFIAADMQTDDLTEFFERLLCGRNILILSTGIGERKTVWTALSSLLLFLLNYDYLSEDALTEQCLAVYRQDWPEVVLENLSNCMRAVSASHTGGNSSKFTLFLDFLSEYCNNLEIDLEEDLD